MLAKIDLLLVALAIACYLALMYDFYMKQETFQRGEELLKKRKRYMEIVNERTKDKKHQENGRKKKAELEDAQRSIAEFESTLSRGGQ